MSSALKMMKLSITVKSTYTRRKTGAFSSQFCSQSFSRIRKTAKNSPQTMKFQAAPCQKPVSSQTTRMFSSQRGLDTRFPPMGM